MRDEKELCRFPKPVLRSKCSGVGVDTFTDAGESLTAPLADFRTLGCELWTQVSGPGPWSLAPAHASSKPLTMGFSRLFSHAVPLALAGSSIHVTRRDARSVRTAAGHGHNAASIYGMARTTITGRFGE